MTDYDTSDRESNDPHCTETVHPTSKALATDGGEVIIAGDDGQILKDADDGRPEECACGSWNVGSGLPCWPCYRAGFDTPASDAGEGAA